MKSNRGSQMLYLIIASVIVIMGVLYFSQSLMYSRKQSVELNHTVIAENYAAELLEYLRSQTPQQLKANFSKNPVNATLGAYKFCAHINLLNRTDGVTLNLDPIAALPPSVLDGATPQTKANRYYQIQIADIEGTAASDSITVNKNYCANTAKEVFLYNIPQGAGETVGLLKNERFIITVGVSWYQRDKSGNNLKQVVLSTLIPEAS
ncbi:MAG: hypothetical protein HYR96_00160 [Deltaproteobacteria bacterium]|nr:hypothetical protein [Deltaproteobacteria bacterium]MBI3296365.1 hypothetical protein [Deltaproteobacteria bacterium]